MIKIFINKYLLIKINKVKMIDEEGTLDLKYDLDLDLDLNLDLNSFIEISNEFSNNTLIKKIIISNDFDSIDKEAFRDCINLEEIDFSNAKIDIISKYCFFGCSSLVKIRLPLNIKKICYGAFYLCTKIKSIELKNIEYIDSGAFHSCTSLETIILDNVKCIENGAFFGCNNVKKIIIKNYDCIFYGTIFEKNFNEIEITCPEKYYFYFTNTIPNAKINIDNSFILK